MSKESLLNALRTWIDASDAYSECDCGLPPQPIARAATTLAHELIDWGNAHADVGDLRRRRRAKGGMTRTAWLQAVNTITQTMQAVSLRFIGDEYGDDDTDAPCDVEWDVHSLIHAVDPSHEIDDSLQPSHVVGTVFPHPSDEE